MSQRLMTQYYSILYYSILQYISVYYSTLQYCIPKPGFWQCVFVFAILIVTDCELATEVQRLKHHGLRVWKYGIHPSCVFFLLGTYWKHDHSPNRIWCYPTIFRSNRGRRNGFFFSRSSHGVASSSAHIVPQSGMSTQIREPQKCVDPPFAAKLHTLQTSWRGTR